METGCFYFLKDEYFLIFPDIRLMKNKEFIDGEGLSDRPCFYSFIDERTSLYWMIPISSKIDKYRAVYNKSVSLYGKCDTIIFGDVLGHERAFLIQNMFPTASKYIKNEYIDHRSNSPVKIENAFEKTLIQKSKYVLVLVRKGKKLIFPDVLRIEKELLK